MMEKDVARIVEAYGLQYIPEFNLKRMTENSEEANTYNVLNSLFYKVNVC